MREIPILFSGPMVRAILAGRKTQTRRPIKDVFCGGKGNGTGRWSFIAASTERGAEGCFSFSEIVSDSNRPMLRGEQAKFTERGREIEFVRVNPPCLPGDLLWVREMWSAPWEYEHTKPSEIPVGEPVHCWADGNPEAGDWMRPRPSIHMPKWAARIWLRVTDVRVERVQDITASAAVAEGAQFFDEGSLEPCCFGGRGPGWSMGDPKSFGETLGSARMAFANAWIALYGQDAWDANQLVWAISFERCEAPARDVKCPRCYGHGETAWDDTRLVRCGACAGTGKVREGGR